MSIDVGKTQAGAVAADGPPRQAALDRYEQAVARDFPRNRRGVLAMEMLWGLGMALCMSSTVVPAYLTSINAPNVVIGFVQALPMICCPFGLFVCHYLRQRQRLRLVAWLFTFCAVPWFFYSMGAVFFEAGWFEQMRLLLFTFVMVFFMSLIMAAAPSYNGMVTELVPLKRRGSLGGLRTIFLALGVLVTTPLGVWLTQRWEEPRNFHVSFVIGTLLYTVSCTTVFFLREHRNPKNMTVSHHHPRVDRFLPWLRLNLRRLARDPNYRVFIFFLVMIYVSVFLGPFIVAFAKRQFDLSARDILVYFTLGQILSAGITSWGAGKLADRFGFRLIGCLQGILLAGAFLVAALVAGGVFNSFWVLLPAFFAYAATSFVVGMVSVNLSVELRPKQDTGVLIALTNLLMLPFVLLCSLGGGAFIDATGRFTLVFVMAAVLAAVSALGFAFLVREPRRRRMYVLRYLPRR